MELHKVLRTIANNPMCCLLLCLLLALTTGIPLAIVGSNTLEPFTKSLRASEKATCKVSSVSRLADEPLYAVDDCLISIEATVGSKTYYTRETCYTVIWGKSTESRQSCSLSTISSDCKALYASGKDVSCWIEASSDVMDVKRSLPARVFFNTIFHGFLVMAGLTTLMLVTRDKWQSKTRWGIEDHTSFRKMIINPAFECIGCHLHNLSGIFSGWITFVHAGLLLSLRMWLSSAHVDEYAGSCSMHETLIRLYIASNFCVMFCGAVMFICNMLGGRYYLSVVPTSLTEAHSAVSVDPDDSDGIQELTVDRMGVEGFLRHRLSEGSTREKVAIVAGSIQFLFAIFTTVFVGSLYVVFFYGWIVWGRSTTCDPHFVWEVSFFQTLHCYFLAIAAMCYSAFFLLSGDAPVKEAFIHLTRGRDRYSQFSP